MSVFPSPVHLESNLKNMKRVSVACLALAASLVLHGCGGGGAGSPPVKVIADPGEAWVMSAPADVGMNAELLNKAASGLPAPDKHGLASMIVLRQGKPVLEHYWNGYDKDTLHDMRSATKSITSLMVGIAIDKGMLGSVDDPIKTYLEPGYRNAPALGHGIALKDLLTMSSGLACNDHNPASPGNEEKMYPKTNWIDFFVNLPVAYAPGAATYYCTAGVVTLGRIVAESSKMSIPDFATRHLFAPLGIQNARWATFDNGRQHDTGGHLYLRPRDMAKIGQLVLQGGKWNGTQLVSTGWITKSTSALTTMDATSKYGYLWWQRLFKLGDKTITAHQARGNGGQYIFVIPELDMVVVFTGENYNSPAAQLPYDLVQQYILPSVRQ